MGTKSGMLVFGFFFSPRKKRDGIFLSARLEKLVLLGENLKQGHIFH